MKICVLAEKPSQARDFYRPLIEKISGEKFQDKNGYYESASYYLAWFYGHLMQTLEPVEYDPKYKRWDINDMPIAPVQIQYRYRDSKIKVQGDLLLRLCSQADLIICATDPDREGEGIFRAFYDYNKITKPVKRLWAVSLTDEDLLKSWNNMKDASAYDNLSAARYMRSSADWLVGMNASRAYSLCAYTNLPIGRVLTPTLALIVTRDREVENYKELFTYSVQAKWQGINFTFFNDDGVKFEAQRFCRAIVEKIKNNEFTLSLFKEEERTENPPKTFNLAELQKEANRRYGFALDKTLEVAQRLYEKKLTTYPRSESQFLPVSDMVKYYALLDKLALDKEKKYIRQDRENVPSVKDTDSAHTAIIPTGVAARNLTEEEAKLYELVRERFVEAFMVPRKYKHYTLNIADGQGNQLKASLVFDLDKGFKALYKKEDEEVEEKELSEQALKESPREEKLRQIKEKLSAIELIKNKKTKPKYYTAATLITAMQNCGKLLEDEQARQILKEVKGIGTPATQANYPVNLEKYGYIKTVKKNFISTPKGRSLIASIQPELSSPQLTAEWEFKLQEMEKGRYLAKQFDEEIREFVKNIIIYVRRVGRDSVSVVHEKDNDTALVPCAICGRYLRRFDWGWACARACGFKVSEVIAGKKLSLKQVIKLTKNGITEPIDGFTSKAGNKFTTRLAIKDGKVAFDFNR